MTLPLSKHPLYKKLHNIRARCVYPSATHFAYYGGRGIKLHQPWLDDPKTFIAWAEENGWRPGLELDRKNPDGDYEPSNCRWVDHRTNSQSRRNARCDIGRARQVKKALAAGFTVRQAADAAGVPYMSAWHIQKGNTWVNA